MSERTVTVVGVVIASIFIGCVSERNIEHDAQARTAPQQRVSAIDHSVPHISTDRVNKGSRVSLFVRQRRGAAQGPVVLFVHGVRRRRYLRSISNTEITAG